MKEVFAAHPGAKKIWVVKGMPFLNETEAKNYALSEKADIEEVERPVDEEETEFEKVVVGSVAPETGEVPPADPPAPPANDPPTDPPADPPAPPANKPKGK